MSIWILPTIRVGAIRRPPDGKILKVAGANARAEIMVPKMIITRIETFPLRIPFKAGSKSDASAWGDSNLPAADSLLVKVTTDKGLEGWGEAFGFRAVASAKLAVDEHDRVALV